VQAGREKRDKGDLDGALEDFSRAHAIMGVPTTAVELAKTQASAGKLVEARDTALSVARIPVEGREPAPFRKARDDAKKLAQDLAQRIPSIRIAVTGSAAEGAKVTLDDREVVALGAPLKVNPGAHEVVARQGDIEKRASVELAEGKTEEVTLELEAPPPEKKQRPAAREPETSIHPVVWVGFAVAGAGAIAGTVTGILSMQRYSELASSCPGDVCPAGSQSDIDEANTLGIVSTVAFAVGGAGLIAGVVGLFFPVTEEEASTRIELGPGFVRGSF